MEEKQIEGKIFIIPNAPYTKKELGWMDESKWYKWVDMAQKYMLNNFGLTVEEPMIQVWAGNEICDNFSDHMVKFAKMIGENEAIEVARENRFPSHLPYSVVKDLKEGDTLTLRHKNGVVFNLKVSQTTTRYARFGNFEDVLEKLV